MTLAPSADPGPAAAQEPLLRAILLESTILPYFADSLRHARKVPVFDAITLADYIATSRTDNPRFGAAFGRDDAVDRWKALDQASMPAVGILRIDYDYPPAPGDIAHPNSYHYRTHQHVAKGLTFEAAQAGASLTPAQKAEFDAAISRLEAIDGVVGKPVSKSVRARRISYRARYTALPVVRLYIFHALAAPLDWRRRQRGRRWNTSGAPRVVNVITCACT